MTASSIVQGARALPMLLSAEQRYPLSTAFSDQPSARGQRINQWSRYRRTGTKGRSCEIARLVGYEPKAGHSCLYRWSGGGRFGAVVSAGASALRRRLPAQAIALLRTGSRSVPQYGTGIRGWIPLSGDSFPEMGGVCSAARRVADCPCLD